jgi:hypothetical protein
MGLETHAFAFRRENDPSIPCLSHWSAARVHAGRANSIHVQTENCREAEESGSKIYLKEGFHDKGDRASTEPG